MERSLFAKRTSALLGVALTAGFVLFPGCRSSESGSTPAPNVLLVMMDTLRADHLGCYGYPRATSPRIDELAASAVVFTSPRSQAACTFPSVNSLLTSRYPQDFLSYEAGMGIPEKIPSLAQMLKSHGYATASISSSPIVRDSPGSINRDGGFGAGFDVFVDLPEWSEAEVVNHEALRVLADVKGPAFVYLHYTDPHAPYAPPRRGGFGQSFATPYQGQRFVELGNPAPIMKMRYEDGPVVEFDDRELAHLKNLYDDEIAYLDRSFGLLLDELERTGFLANALVVVTSDHGEEFMEHGHVAHCRSIYGTTTTTPLIIRVPDATQQGRRDGVVENVDVVPTILDYAGIAADAYELVGKSLRPAIEQNVEVRSHAFSLQGKRRSINDARYKLIYNLRRESKELYDLVEDPGETENLAERESEIAAALLGHLLEWQENSAEGLTRSERIEMGERAEERLKALGYFE